MSKATFEEHKIYDGYIDNILKLCKTKKIKHLKEDTLNPIYEVAKYFPYSTRLALNNDDITFLICYLSCNVFYSFDDDYFNKVESYLKYIYKDYGLCFAAVLWTIISNTSSGMEIAESKKNIKVKQIVSDIEDKYVLYDGNDIE